MSDLVERAYKILFICLLFSLVFPFSLLAAQDTLVLSKVSDNPKKHYRALTPIVQYVAEQMHDLGIKKGKVLLAKDDRQMASYIQQGKVDWITETPFAAVYYHKKAKAEYLLRRWKKGVPEYYTIFITRQDSGIDELKDLKGRVIAFEDPGSTSAYYIPASTLIKHGLQLVQLESPREKPPANMIGYVFSRQEINSSTWVHKRLVDAAAFSNLDWDKDDHLPIPFKKEFKIIHKTKRFPRGVELVRKDLDNAIIKRLKMILLKAHEDPKAKKALRAFQKTTRFDEFDDDSMAGLREASKLREIVKEVLD